MPDEDLLHMFLLRYYDATTSIPREVVVRNMPEDAEVMGEWLTGKLSSAHGAKVRFVAPKKGERAELVELAEKNAKHTLMRYKALSSCISASLMRLSS